MDGKEIRKLIVVPGKIVNIVVAADPPPTSRSRWLTAAMTRRLAAIVFAAALLTGCGFHLRNALNLPENLGPVRVVAGDPYSARRQPRRGACRPRGAGRPGGRWRPAWRPCASCPDRADTPISHDQFGRAGILAATR